jgi:cell wall-associated NlpC family hydrolase
LVIAAGLATGVAQFAGASPQPTISQVQAKINQLQTQFDKAVQQYDQASGQLTSAKARLEQVNKEVAADNARYQDARKGVVEIAAATYMDSGQTSLAGLLTSNDPARVLGAASILTQVTGARNAQTQVFLADAQQLVSVQQEQQHTELGIQQLTNSRAKTKSHIESLLTQQKAILQTLTAKQQAAVAANGPGGSSGTSSGSGSSSGGNFKYSGPTSTQAQKAVAYAVTMAHDNCPYVFGATGPCSAGFDCSGLVMAAWQSAGVSPFPRDTYEEWATLPHISRSQLSPGDLVIYDGIGHVAMYVGGGMIVDAPHSGANVEEIPMSTPWYANSVDGYLAP